MLTGFAPMTGDRQIGTVFVSVPTAAEAGQPIAKGTLYHSAGLLGAPTIVDNSLSTSAFEVDLCVG
jgi:hypothetical protein